jgi:amino acid adenylation domain-containing protein
MKKTGKKNIEDILELTPMQQAMLFHYLKDPSNDRYFEQLSLEISGEIDIRLFERAWNSVTAANEMLRAIFRWERLDRPVQLILKEHSIQPGYDNISVSGSKFAAKKSDNRESEKEIRLALDKIKAKDRQKKFDLREVPFRVTLCKTGDRKYVMLISSHHILYDGWSSGIILKEFFETYDSLIRNVPPPSVGRSRKTKYKEFIKWLQKRDIEKEEKFWRSYLEGFDTIKELSVKRKKQGKEIVSAGNHRIYFTGTRKADLESFVKGHKITLAAFLYTAWGILLQTYDNSDDVVFGTTVSGRNLKLKGIENIVGLFINTIPLRITARPGETIADLLVRIDKNLHQREEYENTPLVDIREYSEIDSSEELFDSLVVIENYPLDKRLMQGEGGLSVTAYSIFEMVHYTLAAAITIFDRIEVKFIYGEEVFDVETIERLAGHFRNILDNIVKEPGRAVSAVEAISEEEKRQLLLDFNSSAQMGYLEDRTIHGLFEEQTARTPDNIALVGMEPDSRGMDRVVLTYRELSNRAEQLACLLRKKGVGPDIVAAVLAERSNLMIIAIIGILKTGGAYLPLDPQYPAERIDYMLKDSNAKILLTSSEAQVKVKDREESIEIIAMFKSISSPTSILTSACKAGPANLAYIIYTSGTTGKPKGILTTHRNVLGVVRDTNYIELKESDRILQLSNYAFDGSVFDIYAALSNGGALVLIRKEDVFNPDKLAEIIRKESITLFFVTTALFNALVDQDHALPGLRRIKKILFGGELVSVDHTKKALDFLGKDKIIHVYGPTETTVYASYYYVNRIEAGQANVPIGSPLTGTTLYVLDRHMKPTPVGAAGELYIGGSGTARGYLNNPELTAEKFMSAPASSSSSSWGLRLAACGCRLYRTGDLVRWMTDGNIEFLGRFDEQVKIRGFRIELGEIENCLLSFEEVEKAIVMVRENERGGKFICAYIISPISREERNGEGRSMSSPEDLLRRKMSEILPGYMIPSCFVELAVFPLTPTGKVDKKALPEPVFKTVEDYAAPTDDTELKLVEIWGDLLGIPKESIGIHSNFFHLGGHSLKATLLASRIHKVFDIAFPLIRVFTGPTIREIGRWIKKAVKDKYTAIPAAEEKEYYILSSVQRRLYILSQIDPDSIAYNISLAVQLKGDVDRQRTARVFRQLISRHESFRTSFEMINGEPYQRIHDHVEFEIEYFLAADDTEEDKKRRIEEKRTDENLAEILPTANCQLPTDFIRPFDLSGAPLLRVRLIHTPSILLVDMHHIISDGISMGIFLREFAAFYRFQGLSEPKIRYKDYAEWQQDEKQKSALKKQEEYWLRQFSGEIPVLELPIDYPRPSTQGYEGSSAAFKMDIKTTAALKALSEKEDATLFMVLLALFNILLAKLSGSEDIVVGVPTAARRHEDLQPIIGMFVNTLALRNQPAGETKFMDFLGQVKSRALEAFENQDYPFEDLVEKAAKTRDLSRNPLFDAMLVLQNINIQAIETLELTLTPHEIPKTIARFDLTLEGYETEEGLQLSLEYSTKLFKRAAIERYIRYFKNTVSLILESPHEKIKDIEILTVEEKRQILYDFNDTDAEYPREMTIHELFEKQVEKTPEKIAIVGNEKKKSRATLTYRELNKKSDQVTRFLRETGVLPDSIVGIMVGRSPEMIVGIFGILKAGAAYLPIEPELPQERIKYVLKDSSATILLTSSAARVKEETIEIIDISKGFSSSTSTLTCRVRSANLAYVIYTSGSTGRPKGVMIEHGSVVNRLHWMQKSYPIGPGDVILQKTSFVFDVSVWELFWWSFEGAGLSLLGPGDEKKPAGIVAAVKRDRVTTMHFVPSMLNAFLQYLEMEGTAVTVGLKSLTQVFSSGEVLQPNLVEVFNRLLCSINGARLINLYGPTEATVDVSCFNCPADGRVDMIPIGKPIDNIRLYVVNKDLHLLPVGIAGELRIAGVGVARGYLNRPELTAERFVDYRSNRSYRTYFPGKIYKTGDLARWLPDGNIEFLGRLDHQVKIRGFRIELEEIEKRLLEHEKTGEAVVMTRRDKTGDNYICAYIIPAGTRLTENEDVEIEVELREYLNSKLPAYMVPSFIVPLDEFPKTINGKVDRKALPLPFPDAAGAAAEKTYIPPRDEVEIKLTGIWSDVLGIDRHLIGMDSNFFALGGHSLKATILVSGIHKAFNVRLPMTVVFKIPSIRGMAGAVRRASAEAFVSIANVEKKDYYLLSPAQQRLYVLQQMDETIPTYNMFMSVGLEGPLDRDRLEETFRQLIRRHESLRTSFVLIDAHPMQRIHGTVDFEMEYFDLAVEMEEKINLERDRDAALNLIIAGFVRCFDLTAAPLLRIGLVKLERNRHILLVDMHHIISDGISMEIFVREFDALYRQEELPEHRLQYRDFSEWQNRRLTSVEIKKQEEFWLKRFADNIPLLDFPTDFRRPDTLGFEGAGAEFEVSREVTGKALKLISGTDITLNILLLAVYNVLLAKYTGQEDIIVGVPASGRTHIDLQNIIGFFSNMLVMRNHPHPDKSFHRFLEEVKENSLKAYDNQDYQFEELVNRLGIPREPGRHPLVDTVFVLHDTGWRPGERGEMNVGDLSIRPYRTGNKVSHFDLMLHSTYNVENLNILIEYSSSLFRKSTIDRIGKRYIDILGQVVENSDIKLKDIFCAHELIVAKSGISPENADEWEI